MEDRTLGLLLDVVGNYFQMKFQLLFRIRKNIFTIGQVNELI